MGFFALTLNPKTLNRFKLNSLIQFLRLSPLFSTFCTHVDSKGLTIPPKSYPRQVLTSVV
jgi:hypothetical protein